MLQHSGAAFQQIREHIHDLRAELEDLRARNPQQQQQQQQQRPQPQNAVPAHLFCTSVLL